MLAGVVVYPSDNPFYTYHTKLWTILHQGGALLLQAGMSERTLSLLLSGVAGMLSFQALALVVFALSRRMFVALGAAFLIFYSRGAQFGVVYPIWLMDTEHTYGVVGLSLFVLVLGLLGSGCPRLGGFLLGVAPAVHPSLGAGLWVVVAVALIVDAPRLPPAVRAGWPYAAAGAAVTVTSLAVQLLFIYDPPPVDSAAVQEYLTAFTTYWDAHRRPVDLASPGVIFNVLAVIVAGAWLAAIRRQVSEEAAFLLRAVIACGVVGAGAVVVTWLPPDALPRWVVTLMPARILNANALMLSALLFGVLGSTRSRVVPAALSALVAVGLLLGGHSRFWERVNPDSWVVELWRLNQATVIEIAACGVAALSLWYWWRQGEAAERMRPGFTSALERAARALVLAVMGVAVVGTWSLPLNAELDDYHNAALYEVASREPNGLMVASGAFHLAQLRSRRPVLVNAGAIDTLAYAPESGPAMDRILRDVYDLDLRYPPADSPPGLGLIPDAHNKRVWEGYSRERWQEIRRTWNVTQVLTPVTHTLNLPIAAQSRDARLYVIPE